MSENCICGKHIDCVEVYSVNYFREGANFPVIDPDDCVDCTLQFAKCPAEAILPRMTCGKISAISAD